MTWYFDASLTKWISRVFFMWTSLKFCLMSKCCKLLNSLFGLPNSVGFSNETLILLSTNIFKDFTMFPWILWVLSFALKVITSVLILLRLRLPITFIVWLNFFHIALNSYFYLQLKNLILQKKKKTFINLFFNVFFENGLIFNEKLT